MRTAAREPQPRFGRPKGMKHPLPSLLTALVLASGLFSTALGASPDPVASDTGTGDRIESPVFVDSTDILYLESFPVQVRLVVRGSLSTPCHEPVWNVDAGEDGIGVLLWSEADADTMCTSVLTPFEVSIPLGDYETADLPVSLNGEDVGRVVVGQPAAPTTGD